MKKRPCKAKVEKYSQLISYDTYLEFILFQSKLSNLYTAVKIGEEESRRPSWFRQQLDDSKEQVLLTCWELLLRSDGIILDQSGILRRIKVSFRIETATS